MGNYWNCEIFTLCRQEGLILKLKLKRDNTEFHVSDITLLEFHGFDSTVRTAMKARGNKGYLNSIYKNILYFLCPMKQISVI